MTTPKLIRNLKRAAILLFVVLDCLTSPGQEISERLILTDTKDSLYLHADEPAFDTAGNYCFEIKENGFECFVTNHGKIGKTSFIGSTYGNDGEIDYTTYDDPIGKPWYYKNKYGTKVFGPAIGKLEKYITSGTKSNIAITTSYADKVYFYANGHLVSKNLKSAFKNVFINDYDWCAFSENGNAIYHIKKGMLYYLFVNGKIIDSSKEAFNELHINNNGDYIYAEGRRPKVETNGYDYMFYVHTKDASFGPVRTVWENDLTENNSWYYSGDDNGPRYILINGKLQKGIKYASDLIFAGKGGYLYTFGKDGTTNINVNGKTFPCPVPEILMPVINNEGDFSFYGLKDYYLYKFINGRQIETPISMYNVRATPLYISPKGKSLHYFKTDDSIYLYRDDTLLFKPIKRQANFKITSDNDLFSTSAAENDKAGNVNSLFYLKYNDAGYWVYNGTFSKPMIPAIEDSFSDKQEKGQIVAGSCSDAGFFSVQKTGDSQYLINVNNNLYKVLNADNLFKHSFTFSEKELIFYGVKGLSIYQFKLSY